MMTRSEIPELLALDNPASVIRIPDQTDVPLTPRVQRIIDSRPFRRLANIRQLGFVAFVYPGAMHDRLEHSLGVYRSTLLFLKQLMFDSQFAEAMDEVTLDATILAALTHDLGHYPFCHPVEDIGLDGVPDHEDLARDYLDDNQLRQLIEQDWRCKSEDVVRLLQKSGTSQSHAIASSILSGPIDVDKLDYLARDSLHAGVPYGKSFDSQRLIASLCLNKNKNGIAITTKGKTAAELLVVARYVMFSEVYWHHAVRSATAMFQRLLFEIRDEVRWPTIFRSNDVTFPQELQRAAVNEPHWLELFLNLFGSERTLYKRWGQFRFFDAPQLYEQLARRPFSWLWQCARQLSVELSVELGEEIPETYILLDAPPVGLEVQFEMDVYDRKGDQYHSLGDLSPIVRALAERQFDDYVKQVRVFIHPSLREKTAQKKVDLEGLIRRTVSKIDKT